MSDAFELPQELNIYRALETRDSLLAWVAAQASQSKGALEISARHVAEIDGAGLQLLAALDNMEQPWHVVATCTAQGGWQHEQQCRLRSGLHRGSHASVHLGGGRAN